MNKEVKICFVCTGNTCRSIMAERICKKILKQKNIFGVKVISRGISARGENISENAKIVLKEMKISSANRKSVKLKRIEKDCLYVTMTNEIKQKIAGRVVSFADLIGLDVLDPYGQGIDAYRQSAKQIEKGIKTLLEKIEKIRREE